MRILIIDDNSDIRSLLEMTVESMGHKFDSANGGLEGLEMIKNKKYGMVFLDLTMPNFSGLDVLNDLEEKDLCKQQPIVLFTASYLGVSGMEKDLMTKGIHSILPKPASIDQIMQKVQQIQTENEA